MDLVLTVAVLAFVAVRLVGGVRFSRSGAGRARVRAIVSGLGWRHWWPVPIVLTAVVLTASLLIQVPGLSWGWWTALGGTGNPVAGTTDATAGTVLSWLVPLVFLAMFVPALPLFAFAEERMFRQGAEGWSARRRAWSCLKFGLAHALIGIPIGVALALAVGGAWFLTVYLRAYRATRSSHAAVLESTRAHTAYNAVIVTLVLVAVVVGVLSGG